MSDFGNAMQGKQQLPLFTLDFLHLAQLLKPFFK
jgi:hypothetical protein